MTLKVVQVQPLEGGYMICRLGQGREPPLGEETNPLRLRRVMLTGYVGCGNSCSARPHPSVGLLESHQHFPAELQLELLTLLSFMTYVTCMHSHVKILIHSSESQKVLLDLHE